MLTTGDVAILPEDQLESDFIEEWLADHHVDYEWEVETNPDSNWFGQALIVVPLGTDHVPHIEAAYRSSQSGPHRTYF